MSPEDAARDAAARWSAAFSSGDLEAIVGCYWPDAILLGTVSPEISEGVAAIRRYFAPVPGTYSRNEISEVRSIVLGEDAVLLAGFYRFQRPGGVAPTEARFSLVMTRRDGEWRIAHHHSSRREGVG